MQKSKLSDQVVKKGKVLSPMLSSLGNILKPSSWAVERFPEYIWMALIHSRYGRDSGCKRIKSILDYVLLNYSDIQSPIFSVVFAPDKPYSKDLYQYIGDAIDTEVLAPITAIIDPQSYPLFFEHFYNPNFSLEKRIQILLETTKQYSPSDSNDATDIRYFPMYFFIKKGRLLLNKENELLIDALKYYYATPHSSEIMRSYRPTIRSLEMMIKVDSENFIPLFWRQMAAMSECNLISINFPVDEKKYSEFITDTREAITYLNTNYRVESVVDKKYSVIVGMMIYAFKSLTETVEHNLSNCVLGRLSVRIIIECYIMIKYLCANESSVDNIWAKYQAYGIGKYKLVLLKAREKNMPKESHVSEGLLDCLVNENVIEEFTEIDLRYFDQKGIREKAIEVGEKDLYDIYYDYDSSYAHGLWGAVRESSMLHCSNPTHRYHSVPDSGNDQHLLSVLDDCITMFTKILRYVNEIYAFPDWYFQKYIKE